MKRLICQYNGFSLFGFKLLKNKEYTSTYESDSFYYIEGIGPVKKELFEKQQKIEEMDLFVKCNQRNSYNNITMGSEYQLIKTEGNDGNKYYTIINNSGVQARYNAKYFTEPVTKTAKPKEDDVPKIPNGFCKCIEPHLGLKKDTLYRVISITTNNVIIDVEGRKCMFLRKRFEFAK